MFSLTAEEMTVFNAVIWISVIGDIALNIYQVHRQEQLELRIDEIPDAPPRVERVLRPI